MFDELITPENMSRLCYTNRELITGDIRGIATDFHGYGYGSMKDGPDPHDRTLAGEGILTLFPFYSPWAWGNDTCVAMTDRLIDLIFMLEGLPEDTPIVSNGESMGGLTALVYARCARRTPVACAANCPVCDLAALNAARPDILRALCAALGHYDCSFDEALACVSPMALIPAMPDIPYYIVQGGSDGEVDADVHAQVYVPKMLAAGRRVTYDFVPGMAHVAITGGHYDEYYRFIIDAVNGGNK